MLFVFPIYYLCPVSWFKFGSAACSPSHFSFNYIPRSCNIPNSLPFYVIKSDRTGDQLPIRREFAGLMLPKTLQRQIPTGFHRD